MDGYAPRSPDLSGYKPQSPDLTSYRPQSPTFGQPQQHHTGYAPQSPDLSGLQAFSGSNQPVPSYSLDHRQQVPQWNSSMTFAPQQSYIQPPHQQQQQYSHFNDQHGIQQQLPLHSQSPYGVQQPSYGSFSDPTMPVQTRSSNRSHHVSYAEPTDSHEFEDSAQPFYSSFSAPQVKQEYQNFDPLNQQIFSNDAPPPPATTPAKRGRKPKVEGQGNGAGAAMAPHPVMQKMDTKGVEVKTKFPTARIKRIMQADEDVGKVAQVTPVVVAKALELFMIRLITASADAAKARGSKKVQAQHMKAAVMQDEQFDNLREIMTRVPDAPAKSSGANGEDDDDDVKAESKAKGKRGKKRRDSDEV